ncbi:hypothetical protein ACFYU9_24175 [Streptomyces sp. NPDC004327]|uniref:hypothetical protein n=1 Tax=unclassified Streptomyces TaxID=2593676 RepID=UPI0036BE83D6
MEHRTGPGSATGCLWGGCLTVLVALLVLVVGVWIWLATMPGRAEDKARDGLRASAEDRRLRLAGAAVDGTLDDAEIARLFPRGKPAPGLIGVRRHDGATTVVAGLLGIGPPGSVLSANETFVTGCFAFDVTVPAGGSPQVTMRDLPDDSCPYAPEAPKPTPKPKPAP